MHCNGDVQRSSGASLSNQSCMNCFASFVLAQAKIDMSEKKVNRLLYTNPASSNAWRVEIALLEKGIPYDKKNIDLIGGEQKKPEYSQIAPRQQVPFLQDGDVTVYESCAILEYLEAFYKDKSLIPQNRQDHATVLTRIHEYEQKLDSKNILASIVFRKMTKEQLQSKITELLDELKVWDKHLEGRQWFANTFSIADIAVFPLISICVDVLGLNVSKYPNLSKWHKAMSERDSVKKSSRVPEWQKWGNFTSFLAE